MSTDLTVPTFTGGSDQDATATNLQQMAAVLAFLVDPPRFRARATAVQSIPNNAYTALTLDAEDIDTFTGHSTSTDTSRYTPTQAGWYRVRGHCLYSFNATGLRSIALRRNGSASHIYAKVQLDAQSSVTTGLVTTDEIYFNGTTDYVEVIVYQSSGGALNTVVNEDGAPGNNPSLSATYIGETPT